MAVTSTISAGATSSTSPFSVSQTHVCSIGDLMLCFATGFEFNSGTAGTRSLAISSGWTPLYNNQEFQLYPSSPPNVNRRILIECWYKIATSTSESATVTMSGATSTFLSLVAKIMRVQGLALPLLGQGPVTRRNNIDLGVSASPWTYVPIGISGTRTGLIIDLRHGGIVIPSGYTSVPVTGGGVQSIHGGDVNLGVHYKTGAAPASITYPNFNGSALVTSMTFGNPPIVTHTGAMS